MISQQILGVLGMMSFETKEKLRSSSKIIEVAPTLVHPSRPHLLVEYHQLYCCCKFRGYSLEVICLRIALYNYHDCLYQLYVLYGVLLLLISLFRLRYEHALLIFYATAEGSISLPKMLYLFIQSEILGQKLAKTEYQEVK